MKTIFEMDRKEIWRKIKKYPYKVSNFGRVKRNKSGINTYIGKILKSCIDAHGYLCVNLSKNGKQKTFLVHRLVAEVFLGLCPRDKEVNHIDGDKQHNYYKNLEYVTHNENMKHAAKNGLCSYVSRSKGEENGKAKLKEKSVLKIKKLYKTGKYSQRKLAKKFDISQTTINFIVNKRIWKHIA